MEKAYFKDIALDARYHSLVVIIGVENTEKYLPIWVGNWEAFSIGLAKRHIKNQRPMTHDLTLSIVEGLGGKIEKVVLSGLKRDTYFALLHIRQGDSLVVIDARPSDSIALALRAEAPIFVSDDIEVIDPDVDKEKDAQIKSQLKIVRPEDLMSM